MRFEDGYMKDSQKKEDLHSTSFFDVFSSFLRRYFPDPFIFAILLTFITFFLAYLLTPYDLSDILVFWAGKWWEGEKGFWLLLEFSMQMCIILVGGYTIAVSPLAQLVLRKVASLPRTPEQSYAFLSFISSLFALINWGLSIVAGGVLARVMKEESGKKRGGKLNPSLLASAGYSGLLIWHGGLSGSAPLDMATRGIPLSKTVFSPFNIFTTGAIFLTTPIFFFLLGKFIGRKDEKREIEEGKEVKSERKKDESEEEERNKLGKGDEDTFFNSPFWSISISTVALFVFLRGFLKMGVSFINLYSITFFFVFLAMLLHFRPLSFVRAFSQGVGISAGIIIQFPFYAGIMSVAVKTGLAEKLSEFFVHSSYIIHDVFPFLSVEKLFSIFVFLGAGLLNIFIPSGGGQWKVQSTFTLPAGEKLGIPPETICMLISFGDELTNMIQPFWAIPILGMMGIKAGELLSFTSMYMIFSLPFFLAGILLFS